jgi:hypothetical protein
MLDFLSKKRYLIISEQEKCYVVSAKKFYFIKFKKLRIWQTFEQQEKCNLINFQAGSRM